MSKAPWTEEEIRILKEEYPTRGTDIPRLASRSHNAIELKAKSLGVRTAHTGGKTVFDHKGNRFPTVLQMCKHYNISRQTYYSRQKLGWPLKDTLETQIDVVDHVDHLGNVYDTTKEMCNAYGISCHLFNQRRCAGWSLEDALTKPSKKQTVRDHKGNQYSTIKKMCEAYGITERMYYCRHKKGWSLKEILTGPSEQTCDEVVDDSGRLFLNVKEMCKANGIPYYIYRIWKKKGLSIKEIKDIPIKKHGYTDLNGIKYKNPADIAKAYGMSKTKFLKLKYRMKWSMENILKHSDIARQNFNYRFKWNNFRLKYKGCIEGTPFFEAECEKCGYKSLSTLEQIKGHRKECQ